MSPGQELSTRNLTIYRFNRLISEIQQGEFTRNTFETWEVEILLDLEACALDSRWRREILLQYQRAVLEDLQSGTETPMKLSQYLIERMRREPAQIR